MRVLIYTAFVATFLWMISCSTPASVRSGSEAYEYKQYATAVTLLQKEFNKTNDRLEKGKLGFMLGKSMMQTGDFEGAKKWFNTAYENQYGAEALFAYAEALKRDESYDEAMSAFKEWGFEADDPIMSRRKIKECEIAQAWLNEKSDQHEYLVEESNYSTPSADFAPSFYEGGVLFTSDPIDEATGLPYSWTGRGYSSIYMSTGTEPTKFDAFQVTKGNVGAVSFSKDFQKVIITKCNVPNEDGNQLCKLYQSQKIEDSWSDPIKLPFQRNKFNYGQPALSSDGKVLFFASDEEDGYGKHDIYYSRDLGEEWSDPLALPGRINTEGEEYFPTLDGDTLYFSSDHLTGMGGLDIFKTYRRKSGDWAPPINLKYPINTGADEFGFIATTSNKVDVLAEGFFVSNRPGGKGFEDIYTFEKRIVEIPEEIVEEEEEEEEEVVPSLKLTLIGTVVADEYSDILDPNSKTGKLVPLSNASIKVDFGSGDTTLETDENGGFRLSLDSNTTYQFLASEELHYNKTASMEIDAPKAEMGESERLYNLEIKLDRIFKNREINLDNIYYDLNKWDIRIDAQPTLIELANTLRLNPTIKIQLSSHTDCRGDDDFNADLSQKRATSAVDFLIAQGIDPSRLTAKGYGESLPSINCVCVDCNEDEHQANRRTTFKILE